MSEIKSYTLSKHEREQIDHWLGKFPPEQKQSALLPALHIVQDANANWLSEAAMKAVAEYLDLPYASVFEVATFYTMYNLEPVGKHQISVCTNISCMLRGSGEIADHFKRRLNIDFKQTTLDGKFTLREVECLAACAGGPACMIDKDYHENLTPAKIDALLEKL